MQLEFTQKESLSASHGIDHTLVSTVAPVICQLNANS